WYLDSGIRRNDGLFTLTLALSLEGRGEWYLGSGIRRDDGLFTLTLALSLEGRGKWYLDSGIRRDDGLFIHPHPSPLPRRERGVVSGFRHAPE
ncbi:MAG: hypothetical protein ABW117_17545, partial [Candidatus Sedimenticola sp. 1PA]